jgi:hypothetical protein
MNEINLSYHIPNEQRQKLVCKSPNIFNNNGNNNNNNVFISRGPFTSAETTKEE